MYLVNSLRLQTVKKLVTLSVFMKSLCACQFSKFSKAVNSVNIACREVTLCSYK